ncbi:MAG: serine/threonine-protein kinase [Acidobacteriota bacterium]
MESPQPDAARRKPAGPDAGAAEPAADQDPASHPEKVGPYRILKLLGEGGMGSVFLAQQLEPVRRQVALKVARSTFLDEAGKIRFEAERQAMARLQHPNVAQIYEAGATQEGHPYFAMELVDGPSITEYCDQHRLSLRQRLRLFRRVCAGVQHAHQKGLIHRDLKPSNILISLASGKPVPKIIDFGIAKALDRPLVDHTLLTVDRVVGTPAYLAPEATGVGDSNADVDTRSDVYSLGILLYELLVGHRPFDDAKTNLLMVLRRIASEDPAEPSTRWEKLPPDAREAVAERRQADPGGIRRSLRGDLDWIVIKAIAKDRAERYDSAAELSLDIERHLNHQPVEASPPSARYRAAKFIRRRAGTVAAAALVLLTLSAGLLARTVEARRANREAEAAQLARQEAQESLEKAQQAQAETEETKDFLVNLFALSDPGLQQGNTVTARELIDRAAESLRHEFEDQPLARARFASTIADVYRKLGLYDSSRELLEEALSIRRELLPSDHPDLGDTLQIFGALEATLGNSEVARDLLEECLAVREKALPEGRYKTAMTRVNLANVLSDLGMPGEAEELYKRVLESVSGYDEAPTQDLMVVQNNLASLYLDQGRFKKAEPLLQDFLAYQVKNYGERHPYVAMAMENLAEAKRLAGAYGEGERLYLEAIEMLKEGLGENHPEVAYGYSRLAMILADQKRTDEAESLFRQALEIQRLTLPEDHPERVDARQGLEALLAPETADGDGS